MNGHTGKDINKIISEFSESKGIPLPLLKDDKVFENSYKDFIDNAKNTGFMKLNEIITLVKMLQKYELDCHVVVAGQNGVGKSYVLLMLLKLALGEQWMKNLMLSKHSTNDLIQFILNNENTFCGIDEMNQYLYYTRHASYEQDHLITTLELARSKRIGFIGCIRDFRKLSLNYRDGKASVIIWIMDRFKAGGAIAAVFVTNPVIESYDKFGFGALPGDIIDFDEMRSLFENDVPSFIGYLRIPHIKYMFKKNELDGYKHEKNIAMAYAHLHYCFRQLMRKNISYQEFIDEIEQLREKLPHKAIEEILVKVPRRMANPGKQTVL